MYCAKEFHQRVHQVTTTQIKNTSNTQEAPSGPSSANSPLTLHTPQQETPLWLPSPLLTLASSWTSCTAHTLCVWLLSFTTVCGRVLHTATYISSSFFILAVEYSIARLRHNLFFTLLLMDTCVVSQLVLLWMKLLWTSLAMFFWVGLSTHFS